MGNSFKKCKKVEYFSKKSKGVQEKVESKQQGAKEKNKKNSKGLETTKRNSGSIKNQPYDEGSEDKIASSLKSFENEVYAENPISRGSNDDDYFSKDDSDYYDRLFASHNNNNGTVSIMSKNSLRPKKIRFKEAEILGHGSFGRVYLGLNCDNGELMAVKQVQITGFNNSQEKMDQLEAEIEILSQLRHKNIVGYIGTSKSNNSFNIFLEYAAGGSIASMLDKYGKFEESLIRIYTKHILCGLEYLHWNKVIHRDIKGGNVLVDKNGVCKLADFGSAKKTCGLYEKEKLASLKGTLNWMAPEVITQRGHGRFADIWSIGCLILEMATGRPPWSNCKNPIETMLAIVNCKQPPPFPPELSPEARDFLNNCFKKIPQQRANIRTLLRHNFVTGNSQLFKEPKNLSSIPEELFLLNDKPSPKKMEMKELLDITSKGEIQENKDQNEATNPRCCYSRPPSCLFGGDKAGKRKNKDDYVAMKRSSSHRQSAVLNKNPREGSKDLDSLNKDGSQVLNKRSSILKDQGEGTPKREDPNTKVEFFRNDLNSDLESPRMIQASGSKSSRRERSRSNDSNKGTRVLVFENSDSGESSFSSSFNKQQDVMKVSNITGSSSPENRDKYLPLSSSKAGKTVAKANTEESAEKNASQSKKQADQVLVDVQRNLLFSNKEDNSQGAALIDHIMFKLDKDEAGSRHLNCKVSNTEARPEVSKTASSKVECQRHCKDNVNKPGDFNMSSSSDSSGNKTGNMTMNSNHRPLGSGLRNVYKKQSSNTSLKGVNTSSSNKNELHAVSLNSSHINERVENTGSRLSNESRINNKNLALTRNENDMNANNKTQEMVFLRRWTPAGRHLVPVNKYPKKLETDEMDVKDFEKANEGVDGHLKFLSIKEINHHEVDVV